MKEFMNILHDIRTGALPASEIVPFLLWLIGKSFWLWFGVVVAAAGIVMGM
jgi:hypothetical protein